MPWSRENVPLSGFDFPICFIEVIMTKLTNEASFHLFVNSLGGDGASPHRFDNRRAARAALGREYANEVIVKTGSLASTAFTRWTGQFTASLLGVVKKRFHRLRSPLSVAVGASSLMHAGFCVSNQRLS